MKKTIRQLKQTNFARRPHFRECPKRIEGRPREEVLMEKLRVINERFFGEDQSRWLNVDDMCSLLSKIKKISFGTPDEGIAGRLFNILGLLDGRLLFAGAFPDTIGVYKLAEQLAPKVKSIASIDPDKAIEATRSDDIDTVMRLVEAGVNPNLTTGGDPLLIIALENGSFRVAKFLVEVGANVNCKNIWGLSALIYACGKRGFGKINTIDVGIVKLLVEHGAEINYYTLGGKTTSGSPGYFPLICATEKGNIEVVRYLVEHGAEVNRADSYGCTSLFSAINQNNFEIVKYLVEHGAGVNRLLKWKGATPLIEAVLYADLDIVKYLVEHGADPSKKNRDYKTPLDYAIEKGKQDIADYLRPITHP